MADVACRTVKKNSQACILIKIWPGPVQRYPSLWFFFCQFLEICLSGPSTDSSIKTLLLSPVSFSTSLLNHHLQLLSSFFLSFLFLSLPDSTTSHVPYLCLFCSQSDVNYCYTGYNIHVHSLVCNFPLQAIMNNT